MAFLLIAVTLDKYCYFGCPKPIGRLGALASRGPFWQLEETLGDHGSSRKDKCTSGARFFMILK